MLHRLLSRIAQPTSFPLLTDWFGLLSFDLDTLVPLAPSDFLKRLKLRGDLDGSSRVKAERDSSMKPGSLAVSELASKIKENFARSAITYILDFARAVQADSRLTMGLVKGMASFDAHVLFSLPLDVASRCFGELFSSFRLKSWVQTGDLTLYRDEYLSFVDGLRITHPTYRGDPDSVPDLVDLLAPLTSLQTRRRLLHIFRLTCLCLTEVGPSLPVVSFGSVGTANENNNFVDVIQPVQSFLATVPNGVRICTTEEAIASFIALKDSGFELTLSSSYDPWERNDHFDCQKIYSMLMKLHSGITSSHLPGSSASFAVSLDAPLNPGKAKRVGFATKLKAVKAKEKSSASTSKGRRSRSSKSADEASS